MTMKISSSISLHIASQNSTETQIVNIWIEELENELNWRQEEKKTHRDYANRDSMEVSSNLWTILNETIDCVCSFFFF